jgi:AcrR family transcriptional regulator
MAPINFDDTHTSRSRLLYSAKVLFARTGYENVSTAAVAREAMTSESQLVKLFGSKEGLLDTVLNDGWRPVNSGVQRLAADAPNAKEGIENALMGLVESLEEDRELAFLILIEGHRPRGNDPELFEVQGAIDFADQIQRLVRRGQKDGSFAPEFQDSAVASALIGATKNLARERLIGQRSGKPEVLPDHEIRRIINALLKSFAPG